MMNETAKQHGCSVNCISWTAVITGALVGIGLSFLLNLFGISIGLSAFTTDKEGMAVLAIGGFIGMLIGGVVSMFVAGWVSGFLARSYCDNKRFGVLYGFTSWCLALLITLIISLHAGQLVAFNFYSLMDNKPFSSALGQSSTGTSTVFSPNRRADTRESTSRSSQTEVTSSQEQKANAAGMSLFLTFVLFFLGALASCFGGYFGLCRCDVNYSNKDMLGKNKM